MSTSTTRFAPILLAIAGCADSIFYDEIDEMVAKDELKACEAILRSDLEASLPLTERYQKQMINLGLQCNFDAGKHLELLDHYSSEQYRIEHLSGNVSDIVTLAESITLCPYLREEAERYSENGSRYFKRAQIAELLINSIKQNRPAT